jgi:hypothetical protein
LLDSTDVSQQGQRTDNTFSTGNRRPRQRKDQRYTKQAHRRHSCHRHILGLLLTPQGTRIPYYRSYYTLAYCEQHHLPHRTQADLGAELIRDLPLPRGTNLIVVGDTAFESQQIRDACHQRHWKWVLPANPERVLAGDKPRPKVSSLLEEIHASSFVPVRLQPRLAPRGLVSSGAEK